MIGLEAHRPDLIEYRQCIDVIESHVKKFTAAELEAMNADIKNAGVTVIKWEDYKKTPHVSYSFKITYKNLKLHRDKTSSQSHPGSSLILSPPLHLHPSK
jgi:hypothetical protein